MRKLLCSPLYRAQFPLSIILLLAVCPLLLAQQPESTASVTIQVTDASGAAIPGAQIRIVPHSASPKLEAGNDGKITVALAPGSYDLFVKARGFASLRKKFVVPDLTSQTVTAVLQVGSYSGPELEVLPSSGEEQSVWKLEESYWKYVEAFDYAGYNSLWHPNATAWSEHNLIYLGREMAPDEWIQEYHNRGLHLEQFALQAHQIRAIGDLAVTLYTVTSLWADKDGRGEPQSYRFAHTWVKTGNTWKILTEMSAR